MKLLFSEATPDYAHYCYPYAVWGFLEAGETPADAYAAGFLPGLPTLDRFYLARQLRVPLAGWSPNSENRRVLRKAGDLTCELVPRADFPVTDARRDAWLAYADAKWGPGIMPRERLERLLAGPVISHVLHFTDRGGTDAGSVLCYVEAPRVAHYYYAFYPADARARHHGMAMMTRAVATFAALGFQHIYLGTCYSETALYKTQFEPLEFFNGARWSGDLAELKHLVRMPLAAGRHRFETPEFLAFQPETPAGLAAGSPFRAGI